MRSLSAVAAVFMVTLLAPGRAGAINQLDFRNQKIGVSGIDVGQYAYVKGEANSGEEELIIAFTNCAPDVVNSFTLPFNAEIQMFLVGGGGAGGYGTTGTTYPGGGGGAGEVKVVENREYAAGTYSITIGRGGVKTTTQSAGENGYPTFITGDSEIARALGGGGGGAKGNGNGGETVASGGGGGGQISTGVYGQGGVGVISKGGNAVNNNRGAGGGGAGGDGGNATTSKSGSGGAGVGTTILADTLETDLPLIPRRFGGGGAGGRSNGGRDSGVTAVDGGGIGGAKIGRAHV